MVTHDQEEALTMADRIVVMDHGVIGQVGTPVEIYGAIRLLQFVADFVGTMNFLPGVVLAPRSPAAWGDIELRLQPTVSTGWRSGHGDHRVRPARGPLGAQIRWPRRAPNAAARARRWARVPGRLLPGDARGRRRSDDKSVISRLSRPTLFGELVTSAKAPALAVVFPDDRIRVFTELA